MPLLKLFSNKVIIETIETIENFNDLNEDLKKFGYNKQIIDNFNNSEDVIDGWKSDKLNLNDNPIIFKLLKNINQYFVKYVSIAKLNYSNKIIFNKTQVNINKKNQWSEFSFQPDNLITGIYFVKSDDNMKANLMIRSDNIYTDMLSDIYKPNVFGYPVNSSSVGKIILFPSFLEYSIQANNSEEDLIFYTISASL